MIWVQSQNCIKLTPKAPPGAGNGTILSTTSPGTRICRLRVTNTVAFAQTQANLTFGFITIPYPTKVFQYISGVNTFLACNTTNCYSNCSNPILGLPVNTTVNMTVLLEGLYAGSGTMNPSYDEYGVHWGATIADKITVELHSGTNYATLVNTNNNVDLLTNGTATFTVPSSLTGNYYITVKHRNSLTTVTAVPVSFATGPVSYNFTDNVTKAYGDNLLEMIDGKVTIFGGDSSQDDLIDSSDMALEDNDAAFANGGYILTDINGDGLVDGSDSAIVENNAAIAITAVTP